MSSLITLGILLVVGLWAMASYARLVRLRKVVTIRWRAVAAARQQRRETSIVAPGVSEDSPATAGDALEEARLHYNLMATKYNATITGIPGSIVAAVAGFTPAELLSPDEVSSVAKSPPTA